MPRSYAALCLVAKGWVVALSSSVVLRVSRRVLAPLLLKGAAAWLPPAAKEGQGDCDFPLGPPWILLYPLKRRRSAEGLEAAGRCVLAQQSALLQGDGFVALRSCDGSWLWGGILAPLFAEQHRAHVLLSYAQKRRRARWPAVVFIRLARRKGLPLPRVSPGAACPRVQ